MVLYFVSNLLMLYLCKEVTTLESWKDMQIKIYLLMLLVPFFWGGAFVAAEHLVMEVSPLVAASFRFLLAGLLLFIFAPMKGQFDFMTFKKRWRSITLMGLTGIFGYNMFFFYGLQTTSAINGSLIIATTPAFMTLGAVFLFKERWNKYIGLGIILSFIGVTVVISKGQIATLMQLNFNKGDILFLLALICWVSHGLLGRVAMQETSAYLTTTFSTLIGACFLVLLTFFNLEEWSKLFTMSKQGWLEMIFMIFGSSIFAFLLWNYGIQQIGAAQASIYMNLVPVNTALLAVFIYGAPFLPSQMFGMLIVLVGVFFVIFNEQRMSRKQQHVSLENKH